MSDRRADCGGSGGVAVADADGDRGWGDRRTRAERERDRLRRQQKRQHQPPRRLTLPDDGERPKGAAVAAADDGGSASVGAGSAFVSVVDSVMLSFRGGRRRLRDGGRGRVDEDEDDDGDGDGDGDDGTLVTVGTRGTAGTLATIGTRMTVGTRGSVRTFRASATGGGGAAAAGGAAGGSVAGGVSEAGHSEATERMGSLMSARRGRRLRGARRGGGDDGGGGGGGGPSRPRGPRGTLARLVLLVAALSVYALFQAAHTGDILAETAERATAGERAVAAAGYGGPDVAAEEGDAREEDAAGIDAGGGRRRKEVYGGSVLRGRGGRAAGRGDFDAGGGGGGGVGGRIDDEDEDASTRLQRALAARQRKRRERGRGSGYGLVGIGAAGDGHGGDGGKAGAGAAAAAAAGAAANDSGGEGDKGGAGPGSYDDDDPSCVPLPTLHDPKPDHLAGYASHQSGFVGGVRAVDASYDMSLLRRRGLPGQRDANGRPHLPRFVSLDGGRGAGATGGAHFAFGERRNERGHVAAEAPLGYAWNGTGAVVGPDGSGFEPPTEELMDPAKDGGGGGVWKRRTEATGDHVAFLGWFSGNYGHFLHDHLPHIAFLRENVPPSTKFLLQYHPRDEAILTAVDPDFARGRVVWVRPGREVVTVRDGTLGVLVVRPPGRNGRAVRSLRRWLVGRHRSGSGGGGLGTSGGGGGGGQGGGDGDGGKSKARTVIYHTRGGSLDTKHGRVVDASHERDVIALVRRKMAEHGLDVDHRLVVFDGREGGETMSVPRQMETFGTASAAIGPHGSGLANILWMMGWDDGGGGGGGDGDDDGADRGGGGDGDVHGGDAGADACPAAWNGRVPPASRGGRPKVLEYLLGPDSTRVHENSPPFTRTYYHLYSAAPWVEYRHVLYAPNSTDRWTFVSLGAVAEALDAMWGGGGEGRAARPPPVAVA